jgi:hypothetical protein
MRRIYAPNFRITYRTAGQPIAVRVSGDPNPANNGLHYLYADHLNSINTIRRQNGALERRAMIRS